MAGKRQSEYPTRYPDGWDKVLLCENPDPAGDASLPGRPTAQAYLGYNELWAIPADTVVPEIEGPLALQFQDASTGELASNMWTESSGVLTAQQDFTAEIDAQVIFWMDLGSNNSTVRARVLPTSTGTVIPFPMWASSSVSRAEFMPYSVFGVSLLRVTAGQTFQFNSLFYDLAGTGNSVQLGSSAFGDVYGGLVSFSV